MGNLKDKAVDIKGKKYVLVSDRVLFFNEQYPNGSIVTEKTFQEGDYLEFKATVTPDTKNPERKFVGHSQATWNDGMVNKTAALENAETSAVGRALAFMGIGVLDSIASADEMHKATQPGNASYKSNSSATGYVKDPTAPATYKQKAMIANLMKNHGVDQMEMNGAGFVSQRLTMGQVDRLMEIFNSEDPHAVLKEEAIKLAESLTPTEEIPFN